MNVRIPLKRKFLANFFSLKGNRITFLKDGNFKFMAGENNDSSLYDGGYRYNEKESSIKVYIKGYSKDESIVINGKNYLLQGDALIEK